METAKLTSKGQITVPKRVRRRLAVGPGDHLAFEFDEQGILRVAPVRSPLPPLHGFLAVEGAGRRLDNEQIDEAIRNRMRKRYGPARQRHIRSIATCDLAAGVVTHQPAPKSHRNASDGI